MIDEIVNDIVDSVNDDIPRAHKQINGVVTKRSIWYKFAKTFFEEDFDTVKKGIIADIIVPQIKGFIADIFIGGIERALYGNSSRGSNGRKYNGSNLVRSLDDPSWRSNSSTYPPKDAVRNTSRFTFEDVVMVDRASAVDLINEMKADISRYGKVRVADLYEILKHPELIDHTDHKFGWTNLDNVQIRRVYSGFRVIFPEPVALERR